MVALSNPLVLWAPAPLLLDRLHDKAKDKKKWMSSHELLERVRNKQAVVVGRKEWFNRDLRNGRTDKRLRWKEDFDREILVMKEEDAGKSDPRDRKVFEAVPEYGMTWAKEQFALGDKSPHRLEVEKRLKDRTLPQGTLEKADEKGTWQDKVEISLRDMYNHWKAVEESHSKISIFPPDQSPLVSLRPKPFRKAPKGLEREEEDERAEALLRGLLKMFSSLGAFSKSEYLDDFVTNGHRDEFFGWVNEAVNNNSTIYKKPAWCFRKFLDEGMAEGYLPKHLELRQQLHKLTIPESWIGVGMSGVGVMLALAELAKSPEGGLEMLSLLLASAPAFATVGEYITGLRPLGETYTGPTWPFIVLGLNQNANELARIQEMLHRGSWQ